METKFDMFEFGTEELRAMALSKMLKTLTDIKNTKPGIKGRVNVKDWQLAKGHHPKDVKKKWYSTWVKSFVKDLNNIPEIASLNESMSLNDVKSELSKIELSEEKKFGLITEFATFIPYFPMKDHEINNLKKVHISKESASISLEEIADTLKIDVGIADGIESQAKKSIWEYGGGWMKVGKIIVFAVFVGMLVMITAGATAPIIGGFVGGFLGLQGAAAMTAGLALLGGGAIATGGAGIAGGTAILVCGGALLGLGSGGAVASAVFGTTKEKAVLDSAKLETVFIQYILEHKRDKEEAILVYEKLRENVFQMRRLRDNSELGKDFDMKEFLNEPDNNELSKDAKPSRADLDKLDDQLDKALPVYEELLTRLRDAMKDFS